MNNPLKSDLACDLFNKNQHNTNNTTTHHTESIYGYDIIHTEIIDSQKRENLKINPGKYATLCTGSISILAKKELEILEKALSHLIQNFIGSTKDKRVIVLGLGNRSITSDSLGPLVVDEMIPTRHLADTSPNVFKNFNSCEITLLAPGVIGQSGISAYEKVQVLSNHIHPDIIFAIDSLATSSPVRLLSTIQVSDSGIMPCSGLNLRGYEISKNTLGTNVISIGVPTVISASTLVNSFIKKQSEQKSHSELENLFVSPNDCDEAIKKFSIIIGRALQSSLSGNMEL